MKCFTLALMIGFSTLSFAESETSGSIVPIKEPGYKKARQFAGEKSVAELKTEKKKSHRDELREKLFEASNTSYSRY
jgi:hypothetical protein